jgi:hypothetical protein
MSDTEPKDIINVVKEITFTYNRCNVVLKENNGIINIGITCVDDEGYLIEKHKTIYYDAPTWKLTTQFINDKIDIIDGLYHDLIAENKENKDNVIEF